jgi:integration host factor subunit beta
VPPACLAMLNSRTRPGTDSGDCCGTTYKVDTGLLKALNDVERQAAQELGQWTEKHQTRLSQGNPSISLYTPPLKMSFNTLCVSALEKLMSVQYENVLAKALRTLAPRFTAALSYSLAMNKVDLVQEVSRVLELPLKEGEFIIETILDSMVRSIRDGEKVEIRGFGSFRTRQRGPRIGRNPKSGVAVEVPAKKIPYFRPSRELKEGIQGPPAPSVPAPEPPNNDPLIAE